MFREEKITELQTEKYIFPFEQAGYLTTQQKLELLLYETERRKKEGKPVCLLSELGKRQTVISEESVTELYLNWRQEEQCFFSWEEKKNIVVQWLGNRLGDGVVGILTRIGGDAIEIGSYATTENKKGMIGVQKGNQTFRFPFLEYSSEEELERGIRNLIAREKHGEMTRNNPLWCHERQDGIRLYASRPPASPHWGMKMVFQNKERIPE